MRYSGPLFTSLLCSVLVLGMVLTPWAAAADEGDKVQITFEDEVPMEDFLRTVAKVTGQPLVWNPLDKNIRGKKIIGGVDIAAPKGEILDVVRSLLTFYELVLIPVGPQGYQLILVMDARQTSSILKLKPAYVTLNDDNLSMYENKDGYFITTTIVVEHMTDLRNARNALTRIVTGQNIGSVTEVPAASAFVVTDFAPNVVSIYRLLKQMDTPNASSSTTGGKTVAVKLEYARSVDVAAVLTQHFGKQVPVRSQPQRGQYTMPVNEPRITADKRTNQVLISGTDAQIEKVKEAIAVMDIRVSGEAPQSVHFVRLTHIQAEDAAGVLMDLIVSAARGKEATGRPVVVAHEQTNALLVSASAEDYARLRALIGEMDTKAPDKDAR